MKRTMQFSSCLMILVACVALVGCSQDSETSTSTPIDGTKFLLTSEPSDALDVITVREAAKDGDDVVIVGRIGGSGDPWVSDRAAFSIVDNSLKACSDIPGDECPQPWDYCCETHKLPTATALIKFVDESGSLVKAGAKELFGVKELSTVVVQGKAKRDEAGNLTVLATGVFVKKDKS